MKQGEDITLRLVGTEDYHLTDVDFDVYLYRTGYPDTSHVKGKADCEQEDEAFLCTFRGEETAKLVPGLYTVEVNDKDNGRIYINQRQFVLERSATALTMGQ